MEQGFGLGSVPIPGDVPAGVDIRYDARFEAIQGELGKMETEGPAAVDWSMLRREAACLLEGSSKDLLVGAWYGFAGWQHEGLEGLACGMDAITGMIEHHWEGLFPPLRRERARASALDWLADRVGPRLEEMQLQASQHAAILRARDSFDRMEAAIEARLTGHAVALGALRRPLRERAKQAERAEAEAQKKQEQAEKQAEKAAQSAENPPGGETAGGDRPAAGRAATPGAGALAVPAAGDDAGAINRAITGLQRSLRGFAEGLRAADPTDARAYLLARVAGWLVVVRAPPTGDEGRTALPAPAGEVRSTLEARWQAREFRPMVEMAEQAFANAPFWLDAHWYAWQGLEALGAEYEAASRTVAHQTSVWVRGVPGVLDLQFQCGTPFCDSRTRAWLEAASGGEAASGAGPSGSEAMAGLQGEAQEAARKGKPRDGVALLAAARHQAAGGRARFVGGLQLARFCLENGLVRLALPLLEDLAAQDAQPVDLAHWEPALAGEAIQLLYRCCQGDGKKLLGAEADQRIRQLHARLAVLDPVGAAGPG